MKLALRALRILVVCLITSASFSYAEENACNLPPKDPSLWDKSIAFGFNLARGNTESMLINLDGKVTRDYENDSWLFRVTGNYGEDNDHVDEDGSQDKTTKEDIKGEVNNKHMLDDRYYFGSGATIFYDKIADIDYRLMLSPSLGYYIIKDSELSLSFEAGPSYIFERVGGEDENYLAPRVAQRVDWKISKTAKLFQSAEVIFDVNDSQNTIINGEAGVEAAINSSLSLVLSFKDNFDNIPAEGKKPNDAYVIAALKVAL